MPTTLLQYAALIASAFAAGMINSVAGGGTLLTFPTLLWAGFSPVAANATSTVALVPGSASAFWGYRDELRGDRRTLVALAVPSALGGVAGAVLAVRVGDATFARLVPWLILGATALFVVQEPLARTLRARNAAGGDNGSPPRLWVIALAQCIVAVYGGFFGAGIGILMLAALGLAGLKNLHRMNALKNFAAVCINGLAAITFVAGGRARLGTAALMALGAVAGGYGGAGVARRIGQQRVRALVVAIGAIIAAVMFVRQYGL